MGYIKGSYHGSFKDHILYHSRMSRKAWPGSSKISELKTCCEEVLRAQEFGFVGSTWKLLCSSFVVMTSFLFRDYNTPPKKELHRSRQAGVWQRISKLQSQTRGQPMQRIRLVST